MDEPRSLESMEKAFVRFINTTNRPIEIIWINFAGKYVRYRVLAQGKSLDVNTYKTHPWIALDFLTKDKLWINNSFIFQPMTSKEYLLEKHPEWSIPENYETRIKISVTIPVYTLRNRVLMELRNYFKTPESVDSLDLPKPLIKALKESIIERDKQKNINIQNRPALRPNLPDQEPPAVQEQPADQRQRDWL